MKRTQLIAERAELLKDLEAIDRILQLWATATEPGEPLKAMS